MESVRGIVPSWTLSVSQRNQLSDWTLQPLVTFGGYLCAGPFKIGYLHQSGVPGASVRSGTETPPIRRVKSTEKGSWQAGPEQGNVCL